MISLPAHDTRALQIVAAIHSGDLQSLERQLRESPALATTRIIDQRGVTRTLLHIVTAWPGHFPNGSRTVGLLLGAGADVDARVGHAGPSGSPETPLHWAASSDDVAVLDALLDGGADIEATGAVFTGGTPLSDAVIFAQWAAARRLLERGATTTLWQAAALGVLQRVQALCSADPAPALDHLTNALWHACRGGQRLTVEYLLARGAHLNGVGHDDQTPLDAAHESGNHDLIAWLQKRGAQRRSELATP